MPEKVLKERVIGTLKIYNKKFADNNTTYLKIACIKIIASQFNFY